MPETTISAYFEKDHDRLDRLFKEFRSNKRNDFIKAKGFFRDFLLGLRRHITWEEEILFPVFETKTGMKDSGPTAVMHFEHEVIKRVLNDIHEKVRLNDPDSDHEEASLLEVLTQHNSKEEGILYPAMDQLLTESESCEIFQKIEKRSAESTSTCCGVSETGQNND